MDYIDFQLGQDVYITLQDQNNSEWFIVHGTITRVTKSENKQIYYLVRCDDKLVRTVRGGCISIHYSDAKSKLK